MHRAARFLLIALVVSAAASIGCRAQNGAGAAEQALPIREQFRRMLQDGRKKPALNPRPISVSEPGMNRVERLKLTLDEGQDAVAVIYRPKAEGKYPAVLVQHFLGATKDHFALAVLMSQLCQRGFLAAAIDGRYRGDRQNGKTLEDAMIETLKTGKGHPFLVDTTYDITRFLDYLVTRPDVDKDRIGMTGFSEGGIITWMSAAADDRIKAAAPIIGVTCFNDAYQTVDVPDTPARIKLFEPVLKQLATILGEPEPNARVLRTAWERLVPGLLDKFDAPQLVPEIAPRPLLMLSHENDELFPVAGAKKVFTAAEARYRAGQAEDRIVLKIAPGLKHTDFSFPEVTEMAAFMEKWLKAPAK